MDPVDPHAPDRIRAPRGRSQCEDANSSTIHPFPIGRAATASPYGPEHGHELEATVAPPTKQRKTMTMAGTILGRDLNEEDEIVEMDIPLKVILNKVFENMGSGSPDLRCAMPICYKHQAYVEFDIPAKYSSTKTNDHANIPGPISDVKSLAEKGCLQRAFGYLSTMHHILVHDYSSSAIEDYQKKGHALLTNVGTVSAAVDTMLEQWKSGISIVENTVAALKLRASREKVHGELRKLERYTTRVGYLELYSDVHSRYQDKVKKNLIVFSAKDVLSYVLTELERPPATYLNEPTNEGQYIGSVILDLPEIDSAKCCGKTKLLGEVKPNAKMAQASAAAAALRFIQSEYKFIIKDLYYDERQIHEQRIAELDTLKLNFIAIADKIKNRWSSMVDYILTANEIYGGNPMNYSASPVSTVQEKNSAHMC
ncbi:hypothetical protein ACP70R_036898 [Stipagrostis hirtigluma subsp. patula]